MSDEVKCAIYARYSSTNQKESSIEDQIRKCKEVANSKGWTVLEEHIYYDKAQSGTQIDTRSNFKKMLSVAMSENCPFKRIIVDDTSRIARNTKEALNIFSLLNFYGIHVYYVAQGIDTAEETAEEMITINGLIDSIYIRNLAKETHRGIEGQVLKGFSAGGKRYGYYSVPVYNGKVDIYGNPLADGYILKINPEEAETVIRIFKLFGEEGYSAKKIVNILNKELKEKGSPKPLDFTNEKYINYLLPRIKSIIKDRLLRDKEIWMIDSLNEQLKKINKEIENFINAIRAGIITETVKNQLILAERKREEIEYKLKNIKNEINKFPEVNFETIKNYLKNLHSTLSLFPVQGRAFLNQIVEKIILKPLGNKIEIMVYLKPDGIIKNKEIYLVLNKTSHEIIESYSENAA